MRESWYDTATICANGHIINPAATSYPEIRLHGGQYTYGESMSSLQKSAHTVVWAPGGRTTS